MKAAQLLVRDARVFGVHGADALAVSPTGVVAGAERELAAWVGPATRVFDAHGATVTPGLTDAHLHLVSWARSLTELALEPSWSRERVAEAVRAFAVAHPGAGPIIGRGWAADGWPEPPHHAVLDAVCPGRAVLLHSKDFHAVWANGAALAAAGVDARTPDPAGGVFERDAAGRPTGVAREHAVRVFEPLAPAVGGESDRAALVAAVRRLHAEGVTAVHDFEGVAESALLREVCAPRGGTPLRVVMGIPHARLEALLATGLPSGLGDAWFRIGPLKLFADGTLGSRTAAMLAPYADGAGRGMDLIPRDELREIVRRAMAGGVSVAVHAIGDRAVRHALDAFESVPMATRAALALPPRIEHAQLVDPADLARFAALGVAASMQPSHLVSDRPQARAAWGPWLEHSYPWAALERAGALLAFGSDAPVEPPSVALGLHAAITRHAPGEPADAALAPSQRVGLATALTAYSMGPAILAGDPERGGLGSGAGGDLVVWDRDLFAASPDAIATARPVLTVIAGRVVHEGTRVLEAA